MVDIAMFVTYSEVLKDIDWLESWLGLVLRLWSLIWCFAAISEAWGWKNMIRECRESLVMDADCLGAVTDYQL